MDIIILAAIAIFIFVKFNKKLGEIDEDQKRDNIKKFIKEKVNKVEKPTIIKGEKKEAQIIDLEEQKILNKIDSKIISDVKDSLKISNITAKDFIHGAEKAYELIMESFSNNDLDSIKNLISPKILEQFNLTIEEFKKKKQNLHSKIISINESKIISTHIKEKFIFITVEFKSDQIDYITNFNGKVIKGSSENSVNVIDKWTFKKSINSKNPIWILSST